MTTRKSAPETSRTWTAIATCLAWTSLVACSTTGPADRRAGGAESRVPAAAAARANLKPWEIADDEGTLVVPDLFYADPVQNEQVMPYAIKPSSAGDRAQIDHLIYPTIGNPALYAKSGATKRLMSVLRLEADQLMRLRLLGANQNRFDLDGLKPLLSFYLVRRDLRAAATDVEARVSVQDGVFTLAIEAITSPSLTGAPADLKRRRTAQVFFSRASLQAIPAGLYDLRMELTAPEVGSPAGLLAYESQFNAVRVFDAAPAPHAKYRILSITDVQTTIGLEGHLTIPHLREFKDYIHAHLDQFSDVAFITFNGDLHNGGSPEIVLPAKVSTTYADEARQNLDVLKELDFPVFLTTGNHDGYVSIGHSPAEGTLGIDPLLTKALQAIPQSPWEGYTLEGYQAYLKATKNAQSGRHLDLYQGRYVRKGNAQNFSDGWKAVPLSARNMVLYDGQNQWRKTYGPLYESWAYGDSYFVSMNTYELRQHRRAGWGMYTVNYGGAISNFQMSWIGAELAFASAREKDIVLLGHHDPRGGHNGRDYPYYFSQIDYGGVGKSLGAYESEESLHPKLCQLEPDWLQTNGQEIACMHDGLQEWMRPDPEFDCDEDLRLKDGTCDQSRYAMNLQNMNDPNTKRKAHPFSTGYVLMNKLATTERARTLLLGHTHFHSLDVIRTGQPLVELKVQLDNDDNAKYVKLDVQNPVRSQSWYQKLKHKLTGTTEQGTTSLLLQNAGIFAVDNQRFLLDLSVAGNKFQNVLQPTHDHQDRELAIIRTSSTADLTSQRVKGTDTHLFGFAVFDVYPGASGYAASQINGIEVWRNLQAGSSFGQEGTAVEVNRAHATSQVIQDGMTYRPNPDNPMVQRFDLKP